jgi:predicted ABC-type ATPase
MSEWLYQQSYNKFAKQVQGRTLQDASQVQTEFGEVYRAQLEVALAEDVTGKISQKEQSLASEQMEILKEYDPLYDPMHFWKATQADYTGVAMLGVGGQIELFYKDRTEEIQKLKKKHPELSGILTWDEIEGKIADDAKANRERLHQILANATPSDQLWASMAGFGTAVMTDPWVIGTLPLMAPAKGVTVPGRIWSAMWREAGVVGGIETVAIQPQIYLQKRHIDSPYTVKDAAMVALQVGVSAGVLRAALHGAGEGIGRNRVKRARHEMVDTMRAEAEAARAEALRTGDADSELRADMLEEFADAVESTPPGRPIIEHTNSDGTVLEKPSREQVNLALHDEATDALIDGHTPTREMPADRSLEDFVVEKTGESPRIVEVDPRTVEVDASTFQFKSGIDAEGVSERLSGVDRWEPDFAGVAVIYETKAGQRFIVDGHQRLALAKRMIEAGQEDVRLNAVILREADGITRLEARQRSALKNVAEGTGSAADVARVLRELGEEGMERMPGLPPKSVLVRTARAIADLDEEAFEFVVKSGEFEDKFGFAAIVAEMIKQGPEQIAVLRALIETDPGSLLQARLIVEQMRNAGFERIETADLFGAQMLAESLFKERARVQESVIKVLKRDKSTWRTLVEREADITGAGNVLERQANIERLMEDESLLENFIRNATLRGPISDALNVAARRLSDGEPIARVTKDFLEEIKRPGLDERASGARPGETGQRLQGSSDQRLQEAGIGDEFPISDLERLPDDIVRPRVPPPDDPSLYIRITDVDGERRAIVKIDRTLVDADKKNFGMPDMRRHSTLSDQDPLITTDTQTRHTRKTYTEGTPTSVKNITVDYLKKRYLAARNKLHNSLINKRLKAGDVAAETVDEATGLTKGERPVVIMLGGGGASGKGSTLDSLREAGALGDQKYVVVNPDDIKLELPEYKKMDKAGDYRAAAQVHEESSDIARALQNKAIEQRRHIIVDRTMGDGEKGVQDIRLFREAGYEVRLYGVTIDPSEALIRSVERYYRTGRMPHVPAMIKAHKGFNENLHLYLRDVDQAIIIDNTPPVPIEVLVKSDGALDVLDQGINVKIEQRGKLNAGSTNHRKLRESQGLDTDLAAEYRGVALLSERPEAGTGARTARGERTGTGRERAVDSDADAKQRLKDEQELSPIDLDPRVIAANDAELARILIENPDLEMPVAQRLDEGGNQVLEKRTVSEHFRELDDAEKGTMDLFNCYMGNPRA